MGLSTSTSLAVPHRSVSQLKSYARCSEQYRLERIARIQSPPAAWTIRGTALHKAIEVWELSGRTTDIIATFYEEYDRGIAEAREGWPDISKWPRPLSWGAETTITKYREEAAASAAAYRDEALNPDCQWSIAELPDGSPAIEVQFRIMFGSVEVIGAIDQIRYWRNGAYSVDDIKAGKGADSLVQLGVYKVVCNETLGIPVLFGEFWSGKNKGSTGMHDLSRFTREFLTRQFEALSDGIEREVYLPSPGDHCKMCSVAEFCREKGSRWQEALFFNRQEYGKSKEK